MRNLVAHDRTACWSEIYRILLIDEGSTLAGEDITKFDPNIVVGGECISLQRYPGGFGVRSEIIVLAYKLYCLWVHLRVPRNMRCAQRRCA